MHKYLYNYEDFLLIDDDYVVRASSRIADGPRSKPRRGYSDEDHDSNFYDDDDYGDYDNEYDRAEDDDYRYNDDRFDSR
jgi:hypothetical protein